MAVGKETALLVISLIWGAYSVVIGTLTVIHGYSNDLVWISIITAVSGTTGAHAAISMSSKGISIQTSGAVQNPPKNPG
jgi:hypothetical protein